MAKVEEMNTHTLSQKILLALGAAALLGVPALEAQMTVKINFGGNTAATWNNMGQTGLPSSANLLDASGAPTGITLATSGLTGGSWSTNGGPINTGLADFPNAVTDSYIYEGPNQSTTKGVITLANLDPGTRYEVTVFGSRSGSTLDPRPIDFVVTGLTTQTILRDQTENTATDTFNALFPAVDGSLTLSFSTNPDAVPPISEYGYLNGMIITAVPEPATYALVLGLAVLAGVVVRRRRMR